MKKTVAVCLSVLLCSGSVGLLAERKAVSVNAQTATGNSVVTEGGSTYVALDGVAKEGVGFKLVETPTAITKTDEQSEYYSKDNSGHLQIAAFDTAVALADGIAFKTEALWAGSRFRFGLIDGQGEQFVAKAGYYPFVLNNGSKTTVQVTASGWVYHNAGGDGTLYIPYTGFEERAYANLELPFTATGTADNTLNNVKSIFVSLDMESMTNNNVKSRHVAIKSIANVDVDAATATTIADLSAYSYTEDETNTESDVNLADYSKSKIVKPINQKAFINENWVLTKAAKNELVGFSGISKQYVGDVKLLHNFDVDFSKVSFDYTEEEKDAIMSNLLPLDSSSDAAKVGYYQRNGGTALKWTIGQASEATTTHNCAVIKFSKYAGADDWENWKDARGISLFVKNLQSYEVSFNAQVVTYDETLAKGVSYRYGNILGLAYFYDTVTGDEFAYQTSTVRIAVPANFEGYIRIPFENYVLYSSSGDATLDLTKRVTNVFLRSELNYNSGVSFVIDDLGIYYDSFTVKSIFTNGTSIADCMSKGA